MYNACLESWKGTYAWWKEHNPADREFPSDRNRSRYDLFKMFTQVREEDPRWSGLDTRVGRGVRDGAGQGHQRCQKHMRPGLTRFGVGRDHPRRSAHNKLLPGDRPPPRMERKQTLQNSIA